MNPSNQYSSFQWRTPEIVESWSWKLERIQQWQLQQLNAQFDAILPANEFYREKLGTDRLQLDSLEELCELPLTSKEELVHSALTSSHGVSCHHTFSEESYSRLHRTSGTTGVPMMILDSQSDWQWWSETWQNVLEAAQVGPSDRVFLAFSFGPFIGFWSAHQACVDRGATVIPGGGLSSLARLEFIKQSRANVLCCTPSYALHLADVARQENYPLQDLPIAKLIVAGESGGSVKTVRHRMQQAWQAEVMDHSGATEVGPWGFGWLDRPGLHVIETSFIAELISIEGSQREAGLSELVLTSLGRIGAPVIRYRTGDAVRATRDHDLPCRFLWLPEGVVGRTDNMVTVRGVNIFPSSIDAVVRDFASISEYRVCVTRSGELDQLQLEIESDAATRAELEKRLSLQLGLRIPVSLAAPNSLPRSELKSRRWQDQREP